MSTLLDAANRADAFADAWVKSAGPMSNGLADALRLLASHARASVKRVTLVERVDGNEIDVLVNDTALPVLYPATDYDSMLDPDRNWLFSTDCLAGVIRALGGTIELVREEGPKE